VSVDASDLKNPRVTIKAGALLTRPMTLAEIKATPIFADSPLVRQPRLSVVLLTPDQHRVLAGS